MTNMTTTLNTIMESDLTIDKVANVLRETFNISNVTNDEIFIKPERKENKDNLITKVRDMICSNSGLSVNPDVYVKIYKTTSEIAVRVKRTKRNSR